MTELMMWATEQFGAVNLGDARRTARLVRIGASAARTPAGTVTGVFDSDAERQGAYDFLESPHVKAEALERGAGEAVASKCASEARIFVPVDGSSLAFTDRKGERGLGAVGTYTAGALGLKVITALALNDEGVPLGPLRQVFWKRPAQKPTNRRAARNRPIDKKETRHWLDAISTSKQRMATASAETRLTFVVDREGDNGAILLTLAGTGEEFIVRGNWDRVVMAADDAKEEKRHVRDLLKYAKFLGSYELEVTAQPGRTARTATMMLSAVDVQIPLKDSETGKTVLVRVSAVNAREMSACPPGEEPLDWLLLTNRKVRTAAEARAVVLGYTFRWRIEEFHKSWKTGHCNVEQSQLRSEEALRKWAIVLAAVASRVERLKLLTRTHPTLSAGAEFSEIELHALVILKRRNKKRNESIPDGVPSIAQATLWLAELGGYTGKSSGGPPGTITISRGLAKLRAAADLLAALLAENADGMR
jgi:hypothetical protein